MIDEALWDEVEHQLVYTMHIQGNQNVLLVAEFFQEMRDMAYTLWLIPKSAHLVFWFTRGKSHMVFRPYSAYGKCNVAASINGKEYHFRDHPIRITTEVRAMLDLLIAQPEEGKA
jgi:hypothetical protein